MHRYTIIPGWLYDLELNANQRELYGLIFGLAGKTGFCYASNEYLAERLKVSSSTIKAGLKALQDLELIKTETQKANGAQLERRIFTLERGRLARANSDLGEGEFQPERGRISTSHSIIYKDRYIKLDNNTHEVKTELTLDDLPLSLQTDFCFNAWQDWLEHKQSIKKPYKTLKAQTLQLKRFSGFTPERFIKAIEYSIAQNWQGIYEEKTSNGSYKTQFDRNHETIMQSLAEIEREKGVA